MMKDQEGRPLLAGYCVDLVKKLAEKMNFDYDLILPTDNSNDYGQK